jgi:hypothetical protein
MSRAYLCDRMTAADDGDRLATLDGIQEIREVPGCFSRGHGLHIPIISDNQISRKTEPCLWRANASRLDKRIPTAADDTALHHALAADPDTLRGSFGAYRALDATIAQNERRKTRRLTLPVLAIGGRKVSVKGLRTR